MFTLLYPKTPHAFLTTIMYKCAIARGTDRCGANGWGMPFRAPNKLHPSYCANHTIFFVPGAPPVPFFAVGAPRTSEQFLHVPGDQQT